jgi:hypothetical protein
MPLEPQEEEAVFIVIGEDDIVTHVASAEFLTYNV